MEGWQTGGDGGTGRADRPITEACKGKLHLASGSNLTINLCLSKLTCRNHSSTISDNSAVNNK